MLGKFTTKSFGENWSLTFLSLPINSLPWECSYRATAISSDSPIAPFPLQRGVPVTFVSFFSNDTAASYRSSLRSWRVRLLLFYYSSLLWGASLEQTFKSSWGGAYAARSKKSDLFFKIREVGKDAWMYIARLENMLRNVRRIGGRGLALLVAYTIIGSAGNPLLNDSTIPRLLGSSPDTPSD